jgi:tRNA (adenine22-N1)-methyltransferase
MISKRLETLVKYIDKNDNICDVGCDHALLDIYLIKNNYTDKIIVSDIHENALNAGIANIKKYKVNDKIDARLGDGLEVLNDEDSINTLLISGMGSSTILKILDNKRINSIYKLILQSNNDHELLRKRIIDMGFYIEAEEYFVDNNKNYINIIFKKGKKSYSKLEIKYGPYLIKDRAYLQFELDKIDKIYKLMPKMKFKYRYQFKKEINILNKLLNKLK